jgi:NADH-ubiquinone oxidoreductase chain 6
MLLVYINKILILFQIIFAFYMCTTLLAIEAVLSLVLTFLVVGLILFFFEIAFLGISYVIVYVGAIAILFLFVIMITPLKNSTSDLQSYHFAILLNTKKYSKRYLTFFLIILALSV